MGNLLLNINIERKWKKVLEQEFMKDYYLKLSEFVYTQYLEQTIYPKQCDIFNAFNTCPFEDIKVVIIGQDPYHGEGQANGLCFSVAENIAIPPSLRNIFKEIENDLERHIPPINGDLTRWAKQGVLLLNAVMTVRAHEAGSHSKHGWEQFTSAVIEKIASHHRNLVFMLWGNYAQKREVFIDKNRGHLILKSVHPSPLSVYRGFYGSNQFSRCNKHLKALNLEPIKW